MKIVESSALWATDVRFLNDSQELKYAWDNFLSTLAERSAEATQFSDAYSAQLEAITIAKAEDVDLMEDRVFATSFSEHPDDINQWSRYAADGQDAIVFFILDRETGVCGFTWFIESHRTSFYIKSTFKPMQMTKVSVHGPDPNHIGKQHFRLDFTKPEEARKAIRAGGGWGAYGQSLPLEFSGRRINKRTVHIVRFSAEWDMFRPGMQRGPNPPVKPKATLHASVAAPPEGSVTHVDLYLSKVRPFWRNNELEIRRKDAGMGPLINDAGMYLTAVISQWRATKEPDSFGDVSGGLPDDQCIRGIAEAVDNTGLLWVCEKMIPKSKVEQVVPPKRGGSIRDGRQ